MYVLEKLIKNVPVKLEYTYARRAQATVRRDIYKQIAACEDFEYLKQAAIDSGLKQFRIVENGGGAKNFNLN